MSIGKTGNVVSATLLLEHNADPGIQDYDDKWTPLFVAQLVFLSLSLDLSIHPLRIAIKYCPSTGLTYSRFHIYSSFFSMEANGLWSYSN